WIVIPAVTPSNFAAVTQLAHCYPTCAYALGIHPLYVADADESDLQALRTALEAAHDDSRLVAIGEIGLDLFVPAYKEAPLRQKQEYFFTQQLKLAREFELPVLLHVRRSQDIILKYLRRIPTMGGIAHAFNGSFQQAEMFIQLGFKLGFGGAMTFSRALQLRRLATQLPLTSIVLETDAPDLAPAWLHPARNEPVQVAGIGQVLAQLRELSPTQVAEQTSVNATVVLPRLAQLIMPLVGSLTMPKSAPPS
ncbi:MAG: TatD family hydrolase, partial [Herbaspirillum sp.]